MEFQHYLTCLWPGMAELWWRGRLSALPAAIGFALALNAVLITRYIYPEWISGGLVSMAFWIGVLVWGFTVVRSVRELPGIVAPRSISEEPDRFAEAHQAFLKGEYVESEKLLNQVLAIEARDPPALLLLTGLYRHTGRLASAEMLLAEVRRLEVSDRWALEIRAESARLARAVERSKQPEEKDKPAKETAEKETGDPADLTENTAKAA
ncbi:MAG: tetratricopeptide repeat protein [Rubripirellula sp.]